MHMLLLNSTKDAVIGSHLWSPNVSIDMTLHEHERSNQGKWGKLCRMFSMELQVLSNKVKVLGPL